MNSLAEAIDQRVDYHSLSELKQTAESIVRMISRFPFLSNGLKGKIRFYKQKLDICRNDRDLYNLSQELLADFNNHEKGSLGELINEATKSWGAKLALRRLGFKKGNDPMGFIRDKLHKNFARIGFVENEFYVESNTTTSVIGVVRGDVGSAF